MKARDYCRLALKELVRKPTRNVLAIGALLLSSLIFVTLLCFVYVAREVLVAQLGPSQGLNTINVTAAKSGGLLGLYNNVQLANQGSGTLSDQTVTRLAKLPHVSFVNPISAIYEFKYLKLAASPQSFLAQTAGMEDPNSASLPLSTGKHFDPHSDAHQVVIGLAYAKRLGFGHDPAALLGKTLTITTQNGYRGAGATIPGPIVSDTQNNQFNASPTTLQATIVGVTSNGQNQSQLFISEAWAREVRTAQYWQYDSAKAARVSNPSTAPYSDIGHLKAVDQVQQDGYTSIAVGATAIRYIPTIASAIDHMGLGEISSAQLVQKFNNYATMLLALIGTVALITFAATSLGIVNTLLMIVSEQRHVIAIWRALGATKGQIMLQYLLQSVLLGLTGGLLGSIIGYLVSLFAIEEINQALAADSVAILHLGTITYLFVPAALLFTVAFSILAGLYPAAAAANNDVSATLASER